MLKSELVKSAWPVMSHACDHLSFIFLYRVNTSHIRRTLINLPYVIYVSGTTP